MTKRTWMMLSAIGFQALAVASTARAAVALRLSDDQTTPTTATVIRGNRFPVSVFVDLGGSDSVSSANYRLQVSNNGSGFFKIFSRSSTSVFTPAVSDGTVSSSNISLSPTSGTLNLGGDRDGESDLTGPSSYDLADYSIQVLPGTPAGDYTLSFVSGASYGGDSTLPTVPSTTLSGAGLGAFTVSVTVPEPATGFTAAAACLFAVRRSRRTR